MEDFLDKETVEKYLKSYDILFDRNDIMNSLDDYKNKIKLNGYKIDNQAEKTVDCYYILNDLCTLGNVQKMYIPVRCGMYMKHFDGRAKKTKI